MIENSIRFFYLYIRIALDPIFPPPDPNSWNFYKFVNVPHDIIENNKYELIFDESIVEN